MLEGEKVVKIGKNDLELRKGAWETDIKCFINQSSVQNRRRIERLRIQGRCFEGDDMEKRGNTTWIDRYIVPNTCESEILRSTPAYGTHGTVWPIR